MCLVLQVETKRAEPFPKGWLEGNPRDWPSYFRHKCTSCVFLQKMCSLIWKYFDLNTFLNLIFNKTRVCCSSFLYVKFKIGSGHLTERSFKKLNFFHSLKESCLEGAWSRMFCTVALPPAPDRRGRSRWWHQRTALLVWILQHVNALITWTWVNLCCYGQWTWRCASRALPASEAKNIRQGNISWDLIAAPIQLRGFCYSFYVLHSFI